jgi:hypothetical protein
MQLEQTYGDALASGATEEAALRYTLRGLRKTRDSQPFRC